jgi:hypothetical protein
MTDTMIGFGYKQGWLAVRGGDPDAVAATLGLRDLGPVGWRQGMDLAYLTDDRLVLTPPLPGAGNASWLLVAGRWLLVAGSRVDVVEMSAKLGTEVQAFATYRVGEVHRWERAVDGVLVRAFGHVGQTGEVTDWRGDPDGTELSIGLPTTANHELDILVSEADVMRLAGAWSVDPTSLDGQPAPGPLRAATAPDDL